MLTSAQDASGQQDRKDTASITSIILEKKSRSPLEQKIDSRLLQAIHQVETKKENTPIDHSQVITDPSGKVEVDIAAEVTDELLAKIKKVGGKVIFPSKQYRTVRAAIPLSSVKTIAGYSEVKFIQQGAIAQTNSEGGNMKPRNPAPAEKINPKPQPPAGEIQNPEA